ncbi:hypothetical protein D3C77_427940 [compost metagenome]
MEFAAYGINNAQCVSSKFVVRIRLYTGSRSALPGMSIPKIMIWSRTGLILLNRIRVMAKDAIEAIIIVATAAITAIYKLFRK